MISRIKLLRWPSISQLIAAAAVLQLILTITVYTAGRLRILPMIDQNGCVITMSPDSAQYLSEARSSADVLIQNGPLAWIKTPTNLHVRLYSISLAILGPLLGTNILAVEPINLLCYIAVLLLALRLGEEVFDRRAGLLATVMIAFWPSVLLHTTQLLKDLPFLVSMLILVLIMTCWLTRTLSWRRGLTTGLVGAVASFSISLTRSGFWGALVLTIVLIGIGLLLVRQLREKRILAGNIISASLILLTTITILVFAREKFQAPIATGGPATQSEPQTFWLIAKADSVAQQFSAVRHEFTYQHRDAGSNMDPDVEFNSSMDVVRYLPRAIMIGFLTPFPNQWFATGKRVGFEGRLLSGLETCVVYIVEILALIGLWRSRSSLQAWLLFLVSLTAVTALTLVLMNLGTLYRMRYAFFILLIILAAHAMMTLFEHRTELTTKA
jgi:hypothetical protein